MRRPSIEITLSLITPFLAYWPPEYLGGSGVLATVTAGLYVSWNGPNLISSATRLQGIFFGGFLMYLIEGMIFLITGLQARTLAASLGAYSAFELASTAIVVCLVLIAARFIWIYPTVYLPRLLIPAIRRADPSPPWQWPFVLSFTGVRGIVSLAAALAIPFTVANGAPFPERDLILFVTFVVILVTLVVQGLLLPVVIRALDLADAGKREHALDHRPRAGSAAGGDHRGARAPRSARARGQAVRRAGPADPRRASRKAAPYREPHARR